MLLCYSRPSTDWIVMGFIVLIMILLALAYAGNWFYRFRHLNEHETRASIDEMEILLAKLELEKDKVGYDREKVHICNVIIAYQTKRLRRLEKRLTEFKVAAR